MIRAVLAASLFFAAPAAAETLAGPYKATAIRVIDGDSLEARVTIWLGQDVVTIVRLAGIDTAERKSPCLSAWLKAEAARAFLAARTDGAVLTLSDIRPDKYGGRVVARVADASGADIGDALLAAGLARPYAGRRAVWCPP